MMANQKNNSELCWLAENAANVDEALKGQFGSIA